MALNQSIGGIMMNDALTRLKDNLSYGETVVVATSGGPDSMALLYLVTTLKAKLNLNIVAAHVNHKMRPESDDEAIMVNNFCSQNGISCEIMTIDHYNDDNFHNDARLKRYDFFAKCVKKCQAKHLLTAHHGDDLMETIIMRLVRGASFKGYAGFEEKIIKNDYTILRPLITYTKDEILTFVKQKKIPYAVDKSNDKDVYTRNRIRKYVLPSLKSEDQNVHQKFYKFSKTIELYSRYIDKESLKILNKIYQNNILDIPAFQKLDEIFQGRIVNLILEQIYQDDLMLITDVHTDSLIKMLMSEKPNQVLNLPNHKKAVKAYNHFTIENEKLKQAYQFEFTDFQVLPNKKILERQNESNDNSNYTCRLNSQELALPLYIRTKKPGDKMAIKGLKGTKKIKDIFIDEKIPTEERALWPILTDSTDQILWLPGLKKSKFDKQKDENYDIIVKYH